MRQRTVHSPQKDDSYFFGDTDEPSNPTNANCYVLVSCDDKTMACFAFACHKGSQSLTGDGEKSIVTPIENSSVG